MFLFLSSRKFYTNYVSVGFFFFVIFGLPFGFYFMISLLLFLFSLPIAETSYSCSHNNNSNSSSDSSKQLATAATATAKYNRPTAAAATAATSKTSSSATTPMQISYTFIEHKYSLGFKEKFLSNLRASRNASGAASNGDQLAATAAGIGAEAATIGTVGSGSGSGSGNPTAGNMLSAVAVGQMCALQNEHIHQNLYKKTIN